MRVKQRIKIRKQRSVNDSKGITLATRIHAHFSGINQFDSHNDPTSLAQRWQDWLKRLNNNNNNNNNNNSNNNNNNNNRLY